ncbi:MAG: 30S ribosomal protein S2 [candidate division Zixibacteria bacterium HGW-Zixibacteria-1]|nr:MAG: 30S ribosomal protein S2 [candidate division Zixibacteria bacterium HGW-Zixibacteria-1]
MVKPKVKELLEAGAHFGHQTRRWNPKMKPFIFTERNGIYIIDLNKTLEAIERACLKVREVISRGQSILFVGTKKQAKDVIKTEAERCKQFFVTERWLGGMLTNFSTIKSSIKKLKDLERMFEEDEYGKFTKKERIKLDRQREKLDKVLGGIKDMNYIPGLVFVVDAKKEKIAIAEAAKLGIPIVAIIDTNADPDPIDFPIAANDDAIKSIRLITRTLVDEAIDAKNSISEQEIMQKVEAETGDNLRAYISADDSEADKA